MAETIKKRLGMPSGNVPDLKYLYAVVSALARKDGRIQQSNEMLQYLAKTINDYNEAKNNRYGISFKSRGVNTEVVKNVVEEIRNLRLIVVEDGYLELNDVGKKVASLIDKGDSQQLKTTFGALTLETYAVFEKFMIMLINTSGGNGIPIPSINANLFDRYQESPEKIGNAYLEMLYNHCPGIPLDTSRLATSFKEANIASIVKRTPRIEILQSILEKYVIQQAFAPYIKSRRVYDFVRSRTTFLEFTNYSILDFGGIPAEVTYTTSDFSPVFAHGMRTVDYRSGKVYINLPKYEEIFEEFRGAVSRSYSAKSDEFGYAKIADVRDLVCREMRIADNLFDEYLKRLYSAEPNWLTLTYSGASDIVTEKRLPILIEKPVRELFTLLRITQRR